MFDDDSVGKLYLGNSNDPIDQLKKQIVEKAVSESLKLRKLSKRLDDIFFEKSGDQSMSQSSHSVEEEDGYTHSESSSGTSSNLSEQEIDFLLDNIVQQEEQERHNDNEEAQEENIEEDHNEEEDPDLDLLIRQLEEESFAEEEEETTSAQESGRIVHNSVNLEAFISIMEFFSHLLPSTQDSIPFARDSQTNYQLLHLFSILTEVQKKSMTTDQAIKYVYDLMEKINRGNQQNPN